ncbi:2-succinyl-5-enolpyruvyl-6-hydroxy-3-cyclohexene-1-carboxylic-acid synthase [Leucobacter zeae]|nr:2-succinyl-5-enolpyruvyl-6-hydroxy-3-cyclohexene-1-carboxylic-acid synthase [Leucobacter zeae]
MFAVELLAGLIRRGVRDVVVCPGSRSQALALAAAAAETAGAVRLHVRLDERAAGFFAVGVARETGMPAPVVVTSGTAVANLGPAVLESHEGRVPFIALTADRPQELRGIRSNQTTLQAHLFGAVPRLSRDVPAPEYDRSGGLVSRPGAEPDALAAAALAAALGAPGAAPAGPVQLNLSFREPLSGTAGFDGMIARGFAAAAAERDAAEGVAGIDSRPAGVARDRADRATGLDEVYVHSGDALAVVIAGDGAGPDAEAFARAAGLPLLAEAVSGARFGREAVATYAALLEAPRSDATGATLPLGQLVERAIVFGHPTLTRQIPALLRRDDVEVIVVDPHCGAGVEHYDPARSARVVREARVGADHDRADVRRWLGAWVVADRELLAERTTRHAPDTAAATAPGYRERNAYARAEVAAMREPITRELLVESVWGSTWPHDRLVVAASRLVRVLDGIAPARRIEVRSNRGLAGIDGTIATALGVATASQAGADPARAAGATRVLIGDLALLHDAGALLFAEGEDRPRIQILVGNDGGGTIFDGLEVAASADPDAFARVMRTPQRVDLEALAGAYAWSYRRASTRSELERLLTEPVTGPGIVEIPLDA